MRRPLLLAALALGAWVLPALACSRTQPETAAADAAAPLVIAPGAASVVPMAGAEPGVAKPTRKAGSGGRAGERIEVAGATFLAGSLPGDDGRDPRVEPPAFQVTLGPYEVDRLPFPNDPAQPPRTDVTRDEAARLCTDRGERLCTELEWEHACRGGDDDPFAAGTTWDLACAREPNGCASSLGAVAMGALREWTASDVLPFEKDDKLRAAVRGARPDADAPDHRCAHRTAADRATHGQDLGFRCCRGAPNAASIPAPKPLPTVRRVAIDPKQVSEMFSAIAQLATVKDHVRFFAEPDDTAIVKKRGKDADLEGYTLTTSPLVWNPVAGEEVLVLAGHTKKDSFVVALWRLPGDRYRIASSMIFEDDLGPFVVAYNPAVREKLLWSSCWKCVGEGGAITLRDGKRIVVVQQ